MQDAVRRPDSDAEPPATLKKLILKLSDEYGFKPDKRKGQCFIIDRNILIFIIKTADISTEDRILEIGPGAGQLTELLLESGAEITAVESDGKLYEYLLKRFGNRPNFRLIRGNILKMGFPDFDKMVSNLPYAISGPLFSKIFYEVNRPISGTVMVQKEFAERITAQPGAHNYGRLSVMCSLSMNIKIVRKVPPEIFYPRPKVESVIIKFSFKPYFGENKSFAKAFTEFLAGIFPYRNKTLGKALDFWGKVLQKSPTDFPTILSYIYGLRSGFPPDNKELKRISEITEIDRNRITERLKDIPPEYGNRRIRKLNPKEVVDLFNYIMKNTEPERR